MLSIKQLTLKKTAPAAMVAALTLIAFWPVEAGASGWVLTQRSKELGDQYVYLSSSGVKIVNPRQGVGLVAKAPNWEVSFYNDRTKLFYGLTYDGWRKKLDARGRGPQHIAWRRSAGGNIAGLKSTKYVATNPAPHGPNDWASADCWVADQIKVPPRLAELLTSAYRLPSTQLVPLKVTYKHTNGAEETLLDTYQQQSTPVPDSYLTAPSGYRLAKSEVEVMMTEENKQLVDDIAKDLGREPMGINSRSTTSQATPSSVNIPSQGVTLPNGQNISKDDIGKYINMYKQYKQSHGQ